MGCKVIHFTEVEDEEVKMAGAKGVRVRWLITEEDGAENFAMRCFEVEPGGKTPDHIHEWEHEAFILEGKGLVKCGDKKVRVEEGYVIFIPENAPHCFENVGEGKLRFLCLVPKHQ